MPRPSRRTRYTARDRSGYRFSIRECRYAHLDRLAYRPSIRQWRRLERAPHGMVDERAQFRDVYAVCIRADDAYAVDVEIPDRHRRTIV
jgi:hypothetical protein